MSVITARDDRFVLSNPMSPSIDGSVRGWLLNISQSGCKLYTNSWQQVNDTIHEIELETPGVGSVLVAGRVVRAKLIPHGKTVLYELGFAFASEKLENWRIRELTMPVTEWNPVTTVNSKAWAAKR